MKNKYFEIEDKGELKFINIKAFENFNKNVKCVFSTRHGGVSTGYYKSMNLSYTVGDEKENVDENYCIFLNGVGFNKEKSVIAKQVHSNSVICIDEDFLKNREITESKVEGYDGLITSLKNVPLITIHADCVPIYFYDTQNEVIGLLHAGWKGTLNNIVKSMIDSYKERFNSNPEKIVSFIGPSICGKCYEVGSEVIEKLKTLQIPIGDTYKQINNEKYLINLQEINKKLLISEGLSPNNIFLSNVCTKENLDMFFSHRGHFGKRGAQIASIQLY